jgi:monoamine oxidase
MIDVLVVGAGVSGLSAAWLLQNAGLSVQVIEASTRVGGRTWSPEIAGTPFDMGATWVWDHETAVHQLIGELGLETFVAGAPGDALFDAGSFVERMTLPTSWAVERLLIGGTQSIANALAQRLESITWETSLKRVGVHPDHLEVSTTGETIRAKHVVLAFPPAHLHSLIELETVPADHLKTLRSTPTWMADIAKIVFVFKEPFWRSDGLSGRAFSRIGPMQEVHDISPPNGPAALFGFIPRSAMSDSEMETEVMHQMVRLFGEKASTPIGVKVHAWWNESGFEPDPKYFGHPLLREPMMDGRLHLCSTETAALNTGHIDGAIERAQEVVGVITRRL